MLTPLELEIRLLAVSNAAAAQISRSDISPYDLGLANGMLLAISGMRGQHFTELSEPEVWRSNTTLRGAYRLQRKQYLRGPLMAGLFGFFAWCAA